jgi:hypothetical protein
MTRRKYISGILQGIPTESLIANIRVKGVIKYKHYTSREFQSKAFECPLCGISVTVKTSYTPGAHIRRTKCPECGAGFCLIFEDKPNWCSVCTCRNLECLKRFTLLAEVLK